MMLLTTFEPLSYLIIALLGLGVGSFCNVVIYRLPIMLNRSWLMECSELLAQKQNQSTSHFSKTFNLLLPRSHCPKCNAQITFWQNIPLLSYIFLHGRCAKCHKKISWRYPLVELLCCGVTLFVFYYFGISLKTLALLPLSWALIVLVFIDFEQQLLPDNIVLPLLWLGLLVNAYDLFTTPKNAILGALFGYCSLWLIAKIFKLIRKREGMGHGDFKLLALFGAWFGLGWQLPMILFLSALIGSVVGISLILCSKHRYSVPIPFGPYLAVVGWIMFFMNSNLITRYQTLFI